MSTRVSRNALLALAAVALCSSNLRAQSRLSLPADRLAHVLERVVDSLRVAARVPGVAIAIVRDTQLTALRGYGVASLGDSTPVDPSLTRFRIGSIAKLFVATAVTQQVSRGRLHLDSAISTYLPDFALARRDGPAITLRHLLTHTAGFEDRLIGYAAHDVKEMEPLGVHLARRLPPRAWRAGERFAYSNYGVGLAAYIVEHATGISFATYAQDSVFRPMGMGATSYISAAADAQVALGYRCAEGTPCVAAAPMISHVYPVGLAYSTGHDMARFMMAALGQLDGDPDSAPADFRAMTAAQTGVPASPFGIGLAFLRGQHGAWRTVGHAGSVPGFVSSFVLVPDARIGVFVTANASASQFVTATIDSVLGAVLNGLVAPATVVARHVGRAAADTTRLPVGFDGTYITARRGVSTIERFPGVFIADKIIVSTKDRALRVRYPNGGVAMMTHVRDSGGIEIYADSSGARRLMVEREGGRGRVRWLTTTSRALGVEVPSSFERLTWIETPYVLNEYISYLALLPVLLTFVAWPLVRVARFFVERRRGGRGMPVWSRATAPALIAAALYSVLFALFGFAFIARSNQQLRGLGAIVYGLPATLQRWQWIPWALVLLVLVMLYRAMLMWRVRDWPLSDRMIFSALTVLALLGVQFLVQWKYLPASW